MSKVRISCKCAPELAVEADPQKGQVILKQKNSQEERQVWEKKPKTSNSYVLYNPDTNCAIKRPDAPDKPLVLVPYNPQSNDKDFRWANAGTAEASSDPKWSPIVPEENIDELCWTVFAKENKCNVDDVVGLSKIQEPKPDKQLWEIKDFNW